MQNICLAIIAIILCTGAADAKKVIRHPSDRIDRVCVNRCIAKYGYNFPHACYVDCVRRGR